MKRKSKGFGVLSKKNCKTRKCTSSEFKILLGIMLIFTLGNSISIWPLNASFAADEQSRYWYEKYEVVGTVVETYSGQTKSSNPENLMFRSGYTATRTGIFLAGSSYSFSGANNSGYRDVLSGHIISRYQFSGYEWYTNRDGEDRTRAVFNLYNLSVDSYNLRKGNLIEKVMAYNGTWPDDGIKDGYWWVKRELAGVDPSITLEQSESKVYYVNKNFVISGSFKDGDVNESVGVKMQIVNNRNEVISNLNIAPDRRSDGKIHSFNYDYSTLNLPLGSYTAKVWSQDSTQYSSSTRVLKFDKVAAPTIAITNFAPTNNSMKFDITVNPNGEALGQTPYRISIVSNGQTVFAVDNVSPNNGSLYSVNLNNIARNSNYTVNVYVTNNKGIVGELHETLRTLTSAAPTLNLQTAEGIVHKVDKSIEIKGTFRDIDADETISVRMQVENSNGSIISNGDILLAQPRLSSNIDHSFNYVHSTESLPNGNYKLKIWAQDSSNYKSQIKTILVEKKAVVIVPLDTVASVKTNATTYSIFTDVLINSTTKLLDNNPFGFERVGSGVIRQNNSKYYFSGLSQNVEYNLNFYVFFADGSQARMNKIIKTLSESTATNYEYDNANHVIQTIEPGNSKAFIYDNNGNLIEQTK